MKDKAFRIMVTGGAGFLGSHLCERLLSEGHEVLCVDNFFSGDARNIHHLRSHSRFEVLDHDITLPLRLEVDQIYNLACPASPVYYRSNPVHTTKTCVLGAINLLELAKNLEIKIFQASTSEVYGDPTEHPQRESYWGNVNPIGPRSCYDEGKRCAETLFFDYYRQHQVAIKVARIFNTYGPRMRLDDGRVVANFFVQALRNKPITIYGDGSQTRSFCFVDDMIEGFIRFMEAPDALIGPLNLGNPNGCISIAAMAEMIIDLCGSGSSIVYRTLPKDDPRQRLPHIERAKTSLHWEPVIELREGLRRTRAYFEEKLRERGSAAGRLVETKPLT